MIKADELTLAIANTWDQIALGLGDDRDQFETQLTTLLRRLDGSQGPEQVAVIQSILAFFQRFEAAYSQLKQALEQITAQPSKGGAVRAVFTTKTRYTVVPVFYGTDRAAAERSGGRADYTGERGDLALGMAEISIPDDHRVGDIERPRWWKLQFREDPERHIVVLGVEPLSPATFVTRAQDALGRSAKKEVLLFVHGYNVGFDHALFRTAQLAYDLHFEGIPMLFSWPSEAALPRYLVDETNVNWSRPRFAEFLSFIRERLGADTVHIIAHSMGNRLVAETIASLAPIQPKNSASIRQIVFAAPDIDAATFKDLAKSFHQKAERCTLYASSKDKAIKASKLIHGYPRAGESGLDLVVIDSMDTIDATEVETDFMAHASFGDERSMLTDIFELIRRGSPPRERFGLVSKKKYGIPYWLFQPE